jgi:transcriptional regulator with XRE-family HTH domain
MSKITPNKAKNVDPEHFKAFKENAQFVLSRGRSQRDIAELLGIGEANLSKYLYGHIKFPVTYAFINKFSSIFKNVIRLRTLSPMGEKTLLAAINEGDPDFTVNEELDSISEDLNHIRKELALLRDEFRAFAIAHAPK